MVYLEKMYPPLTNPREIIVGIAHSVEDGLLGGMVLDDALDCTIKIFNGMKVFCYPSPVTIDDKFDEYYDYMFETENVWWLFEFSEDF